jgi:hypothetical protein
MGLVVGAYCMTGALTVHLLSDQLLLWEGVIRYDVELTARTLTYHGCHDESHVETYPAVEIQ